MEPLKSIGLVALGCAKNSVDLQVMAGHLIDAGFVLAPDPDAADVILVNTCAFIASAREEAVAEILRACELKRRGRCRAVVVTGCLAQRYRTELVAQFPDVDAFLGIDALDQIAATITRLARRRAARAVVTIPRGQPCRTFEPPVPALRLTGAGYAYLKIAEGCAHRCSYCAIPAIRGAYRSRPLDAILAEARALVATGAAELNIIAQDPMLYGVDFKTPRGCARTDLVTLLRALDRLDGDFRVRVLYSYPSEITDAFLEWLATSPRALKYVDVPVQHTVPSVLKAMARGSAIAATRAAAARIRAAVPGVTLRTTVMTGFPGESAADFRQLLADLAEMRFDHLGAFAFSPEEGTPAASLPGAVSARTAVRRQREVMRLQQRIWAEKASAFVGRTWPALVVAPGVARLASQAPDVDGLTHLVPVRGRVEPAPGTWTRVRIRSVDGYDFTGVLAP